MQHTSSSGATTSHDATVHLPEVIQTFDEIRGSLIEGTEDTYLDVTSQLQNFLERSIDDHTFRKDTIESPWREERLKALEKLFKRMIDQRRLFEISLLLRKWSETPWLLSGEHLKFRFNVCLFVKTITGQEALDFQNAIKILRDIGAARSQHWKILYDTIEKKQSEIDQQQQIITCLGFRHVLEMLPDKTEIVNHFINPTPWGATGNWKMTWQFAVERELVLLLHEHIQVMAASGTVTVPALTAVPGSDSLRHLILYDFEEWIKRSRRHLIGNAGRIVVEYQKIETAFAASTAMTATAHAATAPAVGPAPVPITTLYPAPARTTGPQTTFTHLFTALTLKYDKWNCYERGLGLFSELSSSIHKYNKQYEVDETNWGRSDFLVLQWLRPALDTNGEVDWKDARVKRNLPYTP
ncbi:hypothetical protein OEA41_004158 [Lepraria neglecta]|uniref:Uncharacterized protein n=1 Tax=Lepraria neglecta TaxID=209136 RepID=A0AAD9Z9P4_9LECA|nr:hypothetical protein OEA41_004158 [Lepraria neglecta]